MTQPLSPERFISIKSCIQNARDCGCDNPGAHYRNCELDIPDLVAEIERLRVCLDQAHSEIAAMDGERNKLKEEREGLYADLIGQEHRLGTQIEILEKERDQFLEIIKNKDKKLQVQEKDLNAVNLVLSKTPSEVSECYQVLKRWSFIP